MMLDDVPVAAVPRRGQALAAWLAIVLAVATAFGGQRFLASKVKARQEATNATQDLQGRELVAAGDFDRAQGAKAFHDLPPPRDGGDIQRLQFVVLAGELVGPDEALKQLRELGPYEDRPEAAELLARLYEDFQQQRWSAPSLSDADRQALRDQLGWSGALALAPREGPDAAARAAILEPARRTMWFLFGAIAGLFTLGGLGLVLLITMLLLVALGLARLHLRTGSPNGAIYAETFALWMWVFMGLGLGASFLPTGNCRVLVGSLCGLISLSALAWPVCRGVPWRTARREIGLYWTDRPAALAPIHDDPYLGTPPVAWGQAEGAITGNLARTDAFSARPARSMVAPPVRRLPAFLEPFVGLGSYLATLPLLFAGALLTLGLMKLEKMAFGERGAPFIGSDPSHPIAGFLVTADWWGRIQVIIAASIGAPIVEETMFRGVLYRHLREATGRWHRAWSVLASATVVSFVFAVIHPQGVLAVPALMSLAIGFSLAREWRGTLIPCMVAHGLNNFLVTMLLLVSLG